MIQIEAYGMNDSKKYQMGFLIYSDPNSQVLLILAFASLQVCSVLTAAQHVSDEHRTLLHQIETWDTEPSNLEHLID